MREGTIDIGAIDGAFDLQSTLESGQTYLWDRDDGRMYEGPAAASGDAWYWTTARVDGEPVVIRVRQASDRLEWRATVDVERHLRTRLGLRDDLPSIRSTAPDDAVVQSAYDAYWGMRIVRDPPVPTLVSFICSAQMRVERIHGMQQALRDAYGEELTFDGRTYPAYPAAEALVKRSAELVAEGGVRPEDVTGLPYEDAREELTAFVGVGEKVADCVLLFSLGYLEAVPLDTWIRRTIADYYPDCDRGNYAETSRAIREALGGEYAGYTQTYLFHFLRNGGNDA